MLSLSLGSVAPFALGSSGACPPGLAFLNANASAIASGCHPQVLRVCRGVISVSLRWYLSALRRQ